MENFDAFDYFCSHNDLSQWALIVRASTTRLINSHDFNSAHNRFILITTTIFQFYWNRHKNIRRINIDIVKLTVSRPAYESAINASMLRTTNSLWNFRHCDIAITLYCEQPSYDFIYSQIWIISKHAIDALNRKSFLWASTFFEDRMRQSCVLSRKAIDNKQYTFFRRLSQFFAINDHLSITIND